MYVIRVVPLAALPPNAPQMLDYYWPVPLPRGSLVKAGLGRRAVVAVVMACDDLRRSKLAIKRAGFELKKLNGIINEKPQLTYRQILLAQWLSQNYAAGLSTSLRSVAPPFIGKRATAIVIPDDHVSDAVPPTSVCIVLAEPTEILEEIERIMSTARGQVVVVVPEISLAERFARHFASHGPLLVHSSLKAQETLSAHRAVASGTAHMVIGTRVSLALPWWDLSHIVLEDPQHEAYKSDRAPRSNASDVAREVARLHGASLTYVSPALSVVQKFLGDRRILEIDNRRTDSSAISVISIPEERASGNRSLFSRAAQRIVEESCDSHEPVLLYSTRRAYSTAIRCDRCESSVMCDTCGIPMRLHRTSEEMLVCYHCSAFVQVPGVCPRCHAGKLRPSGLAGSQRIAETAARILGHPVPILDSDLVLSAADERLVWKTFDAMPSPVLVATQMVFSSRYERTFGPIIVPQADVLGSDPDFRASERAVWLFEKLLDFSPHSLILQSWDPSGLLAITTENARATWYANELNDRRSLGWPPFTRLVKCSISGRMQSAAAREASLVAERLRAAVTHERLSGTQVIGPIPALLEHASGNWIHHILIKTSLSGRSLSHFLQYVPPGVIVDVDPRTIA